MGFAQKFGPVLSYIRLAESPQAINQVRIEERQADALIGCDLVVSSSPKASMTYRSGHTRALLNTAEMATADFVRHRDASLRVPDRIAAVDAAVGELSTINANDLAQQLLGNTIYANVLMLGAAWQLGLVPLTRAALRRAIELNGVDIDRNQAAFDWGRVAVTRRANVDSLVSDPPVVEESLDAQIKRRSDFLADYQDRKLAQRFATRVARVRDADSALGENQALTQAVAQSYFRLLAYKDEYEVARLHTQTGFAEQVKRQFGDAARLRYHLAPPILAGGVDARGRPRKREFGAWIRPVFRLLASMRGLRGTAFDVFGWTAERRMERGLIVDFERQLDELLPKLTPDNYERVVAIIRAWQDIRGYGPVKEQAVEDVRERISKLLASLDLKAAA